MPARRDMLTGRYNFLERGWGGLEPFDIPLPHALARAGIHSHIETDHYHYFQGGGEFYATAFSTWAAYQGAEFGCFLPYVDSPVLRVPGIPEFGIHDEIFKNRCFNIAEDYHQLNDLCGSAVESRMRDLLVEAMKRADSPEEQYQRLGLIQCETDPP